MINNGFLLILQFILAVLSVWRLSVLITREEPFKWLRVMLGVLHERSTTSYQSDIIDNRPVPPYTVMAGIEQDYTADAHVIVIERQLPSSQQLTFVARGITCPHCVSFWLSFAAVWFIYPTLPINLYIATSLSVAAVVSILIMAIGKYL